MKKILNNRIVLPLLACAALCFGACNDWTETQSADIKGPSFPNDDPELYARYTAALRQYKSQDHLIAFGWFDNSVKQPVSRGQHLASVPDSMDIVSLLHPDNLAKWELEEFAQLREKGTKVIYTFAYADILAAYQATLPPVAPESEEPETDGFLSYLAQQTAYCLSHVDKYGYDGVSVFYEPVPLRYLDPAAYAKELARQQTFVGKLAEWRTANRTKTFVFEGQPQYLDDKSLLSTCDYVVLRAFNATSYPALEIKIGAALVDGVPDDRLILGVSALPLDQTDLKTGRFADSTGALTLNAVTAVAAWAGSASASYTKAGLGIYNLQNDYYNTSLIYKNTREAIAEMNPSPKI